MLKEFFPIFTHSPHLIYLDSGVTTLKPQTMLDAAREYNEYYSANIHRGLYNMSERASKEYEETRDVVAAFIHAPNREGVIFTKGATQSLNMLAYGLLAQQHTKHHIITTIAEHHSNFVPWQQLAHRFNHTLEVLDTDDKGNLYNVETVDIRNATIVTLHHVSNVTGVVQPIKELTARIKQINPNCIVIVDGCQAIAHTAIDVEDMGIDAYVFSGHKVYGPTGVGVLWAKNELLQKLEPYEYGGDMIEKVDVVNTTFAMLPNKFEAGTPPIAQVIGLKAALRFLEHITMDAIISKERELTQYTVDELTKTFGDSIHIIGPKDRAPIISFTLSKNNTPIHPHDIAQLLGEYSICVRAGHHCAQPLHTKLGLSATTRISLGMYNTKADIDLFIEKLQNVISVLT